MFILYFGGQKSGKSKLAEQKAIELSSSNKPYYIATYDNSFGDNEMDQRLEKHQNQRADKFNTIEETKDLNKVIQSNQTYLVDCMSMWILNNIEEDENKLLIQLDELLKLKANIVFVLNDVSSGIIPFDKESRAFVDLTGIIGQKLTSICDEVYEVKFGLEKRLK
jgi:adenosylcobinamide kinase/adenosylcobinamide-phosphate guanylyltransferase